MLSSLVLNFESMDPEAAVFGTVAVSHFTTLLPYALAFATGMMIIVIV